MDFPSSHVWFTLLGKTFWSMARGHENKREQKVNFPLHEETNKENFRTN